MKTLNNTTAKMTLKKETFTTDTVWGGYINGEYKSFQVCVYWKANRIKTTRLKIKQFIAKKYGITEFEISK